MWHNKTAGPLKCKEENIDMAIKLKKVMGVGGLYIRITKMSGV
jgi:hypothetical protein